MAALGGSDNGFRSRYGCRRGPHPAEPVHVTAWEAGLARDLRVLLRSNHAPRGASDTDHGEQTDMGTSTAAGAIPATSAATRWGQLGLGLICMMAISSPQYVWTLFTKSFQDNLGATLPAIQITSRL